MFNFEFLNYLCNFQFWGNLCCFAPQWGPPFVERQCLFCSVRFFSWMFGSVFCCFWGLESKQCTHCHVKQTILKICTSFMVGKKTNLPSFSFSSVFYDLQSFVIKSAKAVSKLKEYWIQSFLLIRCMLGIRWIPNLKFWVLYFILWLVEVGIKQSVGDSVRAVGHQQHCEFELSDKLSWEQTHTHKTAQSKNL